MTGPRITVITPTHNRRESIRRTMEALAAQTTGPALFEAMVVADGCRDDTVQLLRSLELPFPLRVLELPGNGAATARNTGVAQARGEILVCIDDDIEPVPGMLAAYLQAHERHPGHLIIGHCPPVLQDERSLFHMELRNWWQDHILGMRQQGHRFDYRDMHAGNFSIARELYLSVTGFDQAFPGCGGEDYEFGVRLLQRGVPFAFAHDALGWHHEASDLERSFRRARQEGRADVLIGQRHPQLRAGLPLARFKSPGSRVMRTLRNLAFAKSRTGELAVAPLTRVLGLLEWGHLRRRWRGVYGLVRSYWYCRGVADELGSVDALEQFLGAAGKEAPLFDLELAPGLESAKKSLDTNRPQGAWVHYGDVDLGVIPPVPGAEPVRGAHLASHLAGPAAPRLLMALARAETRSPGAWERFFGATPVKAANAKGKQRMNLAALAAGSSIARQGELTAALSMIQGIRDPIINPVEIAENLMMGLHPGPGSRPAGELLQEATEFLGEAERISGTPTLARRTSNTLARRLINQGAELPIRLGHTSGEIIEVTDPLSDIMPPSDTERLHCRLKAGDTVIGNLQLPVIAGRVSAAVIADAISARWGWNILGEFFRRTVYPTPLPKNHHQDHGWEIFLQHFWGRQEWPASRFYEEDDAASPCGERLAEGRIRIEASEEIPDLLTSTEVAVELTVGGTAVAVLGLMPVNGRVTHGRIRAAFTRTLGLELLTAAVREGILGRSWDQSTSLRDRLQERSRQPAIPREGRILPRWSGSPTRVSLHRRAEFPSEAGASVELLARATSTDLMGEGNSGIIRYEPAHISHAEHDTAAEDAFPDRNPAYDRHYFEALFAGRQDPWSYGTPYEVLKYRQTLELIPGRPGLTALELACAEGHFTELLAARVSRLVAADVSSVALERAATRLEGNDKVTFVQLDLFKEPIPGTYDVIVCSEVLYFAGSQEVLESTAARLAGALEPGGHLVLAHANVLADSEDGVGLDWAVPFGARTIGQTFAAISGLRFLRELRAKSYRIQLFQREEVSRTNGPVTGPDTITLVPQAEATPHLAAAFIPAGSKGHDRPRPPVMTSRLPILMYHRIADEARSARQGFQVSRRAFEQQMDYLAQAGFYTTDLAAWATAVSQRRPLPGRAVVITFDDGYQDFADHAWPVLQRYRFGAMVMLITGAVGGNYHWDFAAGAPVPLMGWDVIRELSRSGVTFGSHTASHQPLTGLSPAEIVREAAESRATLIRELSHPVDTIAYPYGDSDAVVRHFMGPLGYAFGLTTWFGRNGFNDSPLSLRRIEVSGFDSLDRFIARLGD